MLKKLISKFPIIIFLLALGLLLAIIFMGKQMRAGDIDTPQEKQVPLKSVSVFDVSKMISTPVSGEIDRTDIVVLRATANGIVTRALRAGSKVYRGQEIVKLADTYAGTSQTETAVAVAQRNLQYQNETADTQRDILKAQKKDLKRTKDRQARIAWKQHYLQERSVELARDLAKLQASQAKAGTELFRTVAPLGGQLEEVNVKAGDNVQAGQVLAILHAKNKNTVYVTAHVGTERAVHINVKENIIAHHKGEKIPLEIVHIAQNGTGGQSYTLTFRVDKENLVGVNDGSFIEIDLPLQSSEDVLIPLDSVHFSTDHTDVYVVDGDLAKIKNILLGEVVGSYVIVTSGLDRKDLVIMERNVVDGEKILIKD